MKEPMIMPPAWTPQSPRAEERFREIMRACANE